MGFHFLFVLICFFVPLPAQAASEWFPVAIINDEVMVMNRTGTNVEACVKHQLEIERDLKKKYPALVVRCSRMTQKVYSENKDGELDRTYQVSWLADFVKFTEVNSLQQCQQGKAALEKFGGGRDLFFCAASTQLIK